MLLRHSGQSRVAGSTGISVLRRVISTFTGRMTKKNTAAAIRRNASRALKKEPYRNRLLWTVKARPAKSGLPTSAAMIGVSRSSTSAFTTARNALAITTPTATSITLPRSRNCLKSFSISPPSGRVGLGRRLVGNPAGNPHRPYNRAPDERDRRGPGARDPRLPWKPHGGGRDPLGRRQRGAGRGPIRRLHRRARGVGAARRRRFPVRRQGCPASGPKRRGGDRARARRDGRAGPAGHRPGLGEAGRDAGEEPAGSQRHPRRVAGRGEGRGRF